MLAACQQPTSPSRSGVPTPLAPLRTPEPKPIQTPATASRPAAQATPALGPPKPGGSVVWAAEADPLDLDPFAATGFAALAAWGDLTYQSLVMFDENLKIVPCLAEAWRVSDDRLTWTFTLRQGVRFHDGSAFEAEDVKFWFERTTAPDSPVKAAFGQIAKVEPTGKYEVAFTLGAPYAPFLATLAGLRGSAIVPRRWMQGAGAAARTSAVGSGPFRIAEYVPGRSIRYVRHGAYWEKGLPYLDEVRLEIIPDEARRVEALRSGRVKYAPVGPAAASQLKRDLTVLSSAGPTQRLTVFNTRRKPFDDVRVRQAIALVVDRQAAIQQVVGGEGRLTGPVPTGHGEWAIPPESLPYRKDLALARHLMSEAGQADGSIKTTPDVPSMFGTANLLAEQAQALGIALKVEQLDGAALAKAVAAQDFDIASVAVGFLPDPDGYFAPYTSSGGPGAPAVSGWQHAAYDDLVGQARMQLDPGQRRRLYDEAAAILLHEPPAIWWFSENTIEVLHPSIKGYRPSFTGRRPGLKKAWLDG